MIKLFVISILFTSYSALAEMEHYYCSDHRLKHYISLEKIDLDRDYPSNYEFKVNAFVDMKGRGLYSKCYAENLGRSFTAICDNFGLEVDVDMQPHGDYKITFPSPMNHDYVPYYNDTAYCTKVSIDEIKGFAREVLLSPYLHQ